MDSSHPKIRSSAARGWRGFAIGILLTCCAPTFAAAPVDDAQAFLRIFCIDCHSGDDAALGLRLDQLQGDLADRKQFTAWGKVFDRLTAGTMPPADAKQPDAVEKQSLLDKLRDPLIQADLKRQQREGRTVLRRLNRVEYEHTLRDLLALPHLDVKDFLPADSESNGFDTVGEALTMSYVQQDAYLNAAESALERATTLYPQPKESLFRAVFAEPPPPRPDRVYPPKPSHGLVLVTNANFDPPQWMTASNGGRFTAPADGLYKLKFRARGLTYDNREQGGGPEGKVTDAEEPHVILLYAEKAPFSRWLATFDLPRDRIGELELTTWLGAGEKVRRIHASIHESGQTYRPYEKPYFGPAIGLESFEAQGPLYEQWPPENHRRLFGETPLKTLPKTELVKLKPTPGEPLRTLVLEPSDPRTVAERLIADFVKRAFRRDPPPTEIARYTAIAHRLIAEQTPFHEAIWAAYQAVLCSPDFLYFQENAGPTLDGVAMANRLSYFLWRSMPDEALLRAGREEKLRDPQVLQAQVERLLDDPRSARFVNDFTDQWLKLREIAATQADTDLYPEYHEDMELLDSLLRETRAYFAEMLRHDLGIEHVVDSDFVMINRRLAKLYDLPEVAGTEIRKVTLPPGHVRGGFITQASVLKVTANGTTTSPVVRGVWLMDRILGSPPPPPPPDVPAIEPDIMGAVTIRDQLAKHRQIAACAVCHKSIDPPGFALECFDILGAHRTHYRALGGKPIVATVRRVKVKYGLGLKVESNGETDDGRTFADLHEFQRILLADKPRLARNLIERLITYSTGAPVQFGDRPDVEQMVNDLADERFGLRSMIHAVVRSRMFQHK